MTQSEKIGYAFEHVCLTELAALGIKTISHEAIDDSSIVADITISHKGQTFVLFLTHTRTQGMTNRKFYRTFEELSQRRIKTPKAICFELSLFNAGVRSPGQYGMLYQKLFDGSESILKTQQQDSFLRFVRSLPDPISQEVVSSRIGELPQPILARIRAVLKGILACTRKTPEVLQKYWQQEARVKPGSVSFDAESKVSVKLGLKLLALLEGTFLEGENLSKQALTVAKKVKTEEIELLKDRAVIIDGALRIGRVSVTLSPHVCCAFNRLLDFGISLNTGWITPYLASTGAVLLYKQLMNPESSKNALEVAIKKVEAATNSEALFQLWISDLSSESPRADLIDSSLRLAGLSQNDLSTQTEEKLDLHIAQRNPMWFIIAKEDYDSIIDDVSGFLKTASAIVWEKLTTRKCAIDFWDFYRDRRKTFLSHRSVNPELILVDLATHKLTKIKAKSRVSVLPRVAGLPSKYSMSVQSSKRLLMPNGRELFIISISTPDPQHHKHKEFSGKLRAIRHFWDSKKNAIIDGNCTFLCVIDGAWSDKQIKMLSSAGWEVTGWDNLSDAVQSLNDR